LYHRTVKKINYGRYYAAQAGPLKKITPHHYQLCARTVWNIICTAALLINNNRGHHYIANAVPLKTITPHHYRICARTVRNIVYRSLSKTKKIMATFM
jgi:hypothetical protein